MPPCFRSTMALAASTRLEDCGGNPVTIWKVSSDRPIAKTLTNAARAGDQVLTWRMAMLPSPPATGVNTSFCLREYRRGEQPITRRKALLNALSDS
jgi:hypothetical protein